MENFNATHNQRLKFINIPIDDQLVMIRYELDRIPPNNIHFKVNLMDLANLLIILNKNNLAEIGLELDIEIIENDQTTVVPLPIPETIMLATPTQLIQTELESVQ